ncbi:MAG: phosphoribosylanthranilate isomerase [Ruminiclostridium sp.]|nr:phosphoribosylanthranilate isomerase [Ruminiclostridium sp.]
MSKIKLCGLSRKCDIEWANALKPEYIGFVFWSKSKRNVPPEKAKELKDLLSPDIKAVGVFVDEPIENVAELLNDNIIDIAQLHGGEDEEYIKKLRALSGKPIIKAFLLKSESDAERAEKSTADYILVDSGTGTGKSFDWELLKNISRPYFLAGGLCCENISQAITALDPYAVDVSSGIETNGCKDKNKMAAFVAAVRKEI